MSESNVPEIIKYLTEDNLKLMYGRLNRRYEVVDELPVAGTLSPADKKVIYVVKETVGETVRYWPNVLDNGEWKPFGIGQDDLDGKIDKVDAEEGHLVAADENGNLVDAGLLPGTFVALSFDPTEQIQPHATDIRRIWNAFQTGMLVILLDNRTGGTGLYASLNAAGYTWPDGNHMTERLVDVDENYRSCNDTIPGYYDSDTKKFYDDIYHSIEIDPIEDALYHDLTGDKVYLYAEREFVRVLRFVQFSTNELMKDDPVWPSRKSTRPVFFRIFEPMTSATANNFYVVYGEYTTTIKVNVDPDIMYGNGVDKPLGVYAYNGEKAGLVPDAPDSDPDKKFLRADGQWATIVIPDQVQSDWEQDDSEAKDFIKNKPDLADVATSGSYDDLEDKPGTFAPASAQQNGTDGFVPAPQAGDQDKYLKGDGTWVSINIPDAPDFTGGDMVEIGTGKPYTTIRAGFVAAYAKKNCKVYVYPGTYDLVTEFADILHTITGKVGNKVGNGMHVVFYDGAKVEAIFDNSDSEYTQSEWENILDYFNPFYAETGDFVVENLNIEAQNCRYCFHDELSDSPTQYNHKYLNCHMIKRTTTPERKYMMCIGGGLGKYGTIDITGGAYQSITSVGIPEISNGDPADAQMCISYHNGAVAGAKSSINIKNVYVKDRGYIQVEDHGPSTLVTPMLISGCSFGLPVLHRKTSSSVGDNTTFTMWCSEQRVAGSWTVNVNYADFVPSN